MVTDLMPERIKGEADSHYRFTREHNALNIIFISA